MRGVIIAAMTQDRNRAQGGPAVTRPASGITIVPAQLTRMRDLRALSREDLAERTGEILFDRDLFTRVLSGRTAPDARMVRALWLALDCEPGDLIPALPPRLTRTGAPRWLRGNPGWALDLDAVNRLREERGWTPADLAAAASRYWFSRDSVNKIERGERRPKARTLRAFCQILGCTPADLMPGGRPLPDGQTSTHRDLMDYNAGMRAFADENGISYRYQRAEGKPGRIRYTQELREKYAGYLAGQPADGPLESLPGLRRRPPRFTI